MENKYSFRNASLFIGEAVMEVRITNTRLVVIILLMSLLSMQLSATVCNAHPNVVQPKQKSNINLPKQVVAPATMKPAALSFVENRGQIRDQFYKPRPDIQYSLHASNGLVIFIGNNALHYQFSKVRIPKNAKGNIGPKKENFMSPTDRWHEIQTGSTCDMYRMDVELVGANEHASVVAEQQQNYYENYFTPGTGDRGAMASAYNRITYKNVYPNIDWVLYTSNGHLKHEFIIREGGKAADIKLKYGGAISLQLGKDGSLTAETPHGIITEQAPYTYKKDGSSVNCSFKLDNNILSYLTSEYRGELIIDPTIAWATYYGGSGNDEGYSVATDASGNVFLAGCTSSNSNIATSGAYQTTIAGDYDAFLVKFNSSGVRQWATYYGGSSSDRAFSVVVDGSGNVYFGGTTSSSNGIATSGTHQTTIGGSDDAFVAKFNNAGTRLWSTYYGGDSSDKGYALAIDGSKNVFLTGYTLSSIGIATSGAHQITIGGTDDAFLVKFDSTGTRQWATYYGGNGSDQGCSIAIDGSKNIILAGYSSSNIGISTSGSYQGTIGGNYDAFLVKFNNSGVRQWASYYGGSNSDKGYAVAVDASRNIFLTGSTSSTSGIANSCGDDNTFNGNTDAFLVKFDSTGNRRWATYFGGSGNDVGYSIATYPSGALYLTGYTESSSGLIPGGYSGGGDGFVARFNTSGGALIYWASRYFGSNSFDCVYSSAISGSNVYLAGVTLSDSGISTAGSYQNSFGGDNEAFLVSFHEDTYYPDPVPTQIFGSCVGISGIAPFTFDPGGTWTSSNTAIVTVNPATGVYTGISAGNAVLTYTIQCGSEIFLIGFSSPVGPISGITSICSGATTTLNDTTTGGSWVSSNVSKATVGSTTGIVTGISPGTVLISYTKPGRCPKSIVVTVNALPTVNAGSNIAVCNGSSATLTATGGISYSWSPSAGLSANTGTAVIASPTVTITYTVTGTDINSCVNTATKIVTVNTLPTISLGSGVAICYGSSTILTASGGSTYSWVPSTGLSATTGASISASPTVTTTYTVTGTNGAGCQNTAIVTVTVNSLPTVNAGSGVAICAGTTATLTATGAVTYSWVPSTGLSVTTGASISASPTVTTTYTVTGTNGAGCQNTVIVTVTVNSLPTIGAGSGTAICAGATATLTATGAVTYSWVPSTGLSATTGASISTSPTVTTTYTVTGTNSAGCQNTAIVTVTVNSLPTVDAGSAIVICTGTSTTLTATGAATYSWVPSTGLSATTGAGISASPSVTTIYTVTGTSGAGCQNTAIVTVSVNSLPTIGTGSGVTICAGAGATLTATGAVTYLWVPSAGLSATTGASISANPTVTTTYTVTGTNDTGCQNTATVTVTINSLPAVEAESGVAICTGASTTLTASGGVTYSWSPSTGLSVTTGASITANPTVTTTYTVTGGDASGCANTSTVTVTVNPLPTISAGTGVAICNGSPTTLIATGGATYLWLPSTGLSPNTGASVTANPTVTTTYTATGTNANGCQNTAIKIVTVNSVPTIVVGSGVAICSGSSTTLTATGGITYSWLPSTGLSATTGASVTANPTSTKTYTIIGTGSNGCTGAVSKIITVDNPPSTITTYAGNGSTGYGGDGEMATNATLNNPWGLAADGNGNLYFADQTNQRIRKINSSGVITTIAGNGEAGNYGDGGAATAAQLYNPHCVAVDAIGNVYVSDFSNNRVRKINTTGIISTIAGTGIGGFSGDGDVATAAKLNGPVGVAVDGTGNVYISDYGNNRIRKVNTSGVITTIGGNGSSGYSGDGGAATSAQINAPRGIAVSIWGYVYFADNSHRVRRISTGFDGIIRTIAGTGTPGYSGDGGNGYSAQINSPQGVACDAMGNVYIGEELGNRVRKVDDFGIISTITGTGTGSYSGDGGTPVGAGVHYAIGTAVDADGNVYFSDIANQRVRKISSGIVLLPIVGDSTVCAYQYIDLHNNTQIGGLWSSSNTSVASVAPAGITTNVASAYGLTAGTAVISYTVSNTCGSFSTTQSLSVNPFLDAGTITSTQYFVCSGSSISFTSSVPGGVWSSSNTSIASVNPASGNLVGIAAGTVVISYIIADSFATKTITVNAAPASITGNAPVCSGATTTLNSAPADGTWSSSNTARATVNSTSGIVTGIATGTANISYTLSSGCFTKIIVTVNPSLSTIGGSNSVCVDASISLTQSITGGTWSSSSSSIATVGTSGIVTGIAAGTTIISYARCSALKTKVITVNALPSVPPITAASGTVCAGSTLALTESTTGGTHVWSSNNLSVATVNSSLGKVTGISGGTAIISYKYTLGCTNYAMTTVTVNPTTIASVTGTTVVCAGSTTSLTGLPAGGAWSSSAPAKATIGSATGMVAGIAAGTTNISYTYTNESGCTKIATVNATVNALPTVSGIVGSGSLCAGATATFTDPTTGGMWSSASPSVASIGSSSGIITGAGTGTATITYAFTGANGCTGIRTKPVTVNALPSVPEITGAAFTLCQVATLTLTESTPGGSHVWSSDNTSVATVNASTGVVSGVAPGTATISYAYTLVCTNYAAKMVTVNPTTTVAGIDGPDIVAMGGSISLSNSTPGGTWSSSNAAKATVTAGGVVTGVSAGIVNITYSVTSCGTARDIQTVTVTASKYAVNSSTDTKNEIYIFPNPTAGTLTVQSEGNGSIILYTLDGKLIAQYDTYAGSTALSLPNDIASGVYLCKYIGTNGSVEIVRLTYIH